MAVAQSYVTASALVIVTAAVFVPEAGRPGWAPLLAVVSMIAAVAFGIYEALDSDRIWSLAEVLSAALPLPLLLLVGQMSRERPLGGPSRWGFRAGAALAAASLLLGIHTSVESGGSWFWDFLELSCWPEEVSANRRQPVALIAASAVAASGLAFGVHLADIFPIGGLWIFLSQVSARLALALLLVTVAGIARPGVAYGGAVLIVAGTVSSSLWWATSDWTAHFDGWLFLLTATVQFAYVALIILSATAIESADSAGQRPAPVSASASST